VLHYDDRSAIDVKSRLVDDVSQYVCVLWLARLLWVVRIIETVVSE